MLEILIVLISAIPVDFNAIRPMLMLAPLAAIAVRRAPISIKAFALYGGASWAIAATSLDINPELFRLRHDAMLELLTIAAPIAIAALCPTIRLINIVRCAAFISAVVTIFQAGVGLDPSGTWVNNSVNGCFLALASSFAGPFWWFLALAAVLSKSSMAVGTVIVILLLKTRSVKILAVVGIAALVGFYLAGVSDTGRIGLWSLALPMFLDAPILGHGFGSIGGHLAVLQNATGYMLYPMQLAGQTVTTGYFPNLHNEPFQVLLEGGLIGLGLYAWVHAQILLLNPARGKLIPLIACVACSIGSPIWHWPMTALIYAIAIKQCHEKEASIEL